jgi:hypothetical protein
MFADDLNDMTDSLLDVFGEPATVVLEDLTEHAVTGIFDGERDDIESNVAAGWRYTLAVKTSDIAGIGIERRNTVTRAGLIYTIVDITPDEGGMTTLIMRRYGSHGS